MGGGGSDTHQSLLSVGLPQALLRRLCHSLAMESEGTYLAAVQCDGMYIQILDTGNAASLPQRKVVPKVGRSYPVIS